ncbi:MAG: universal stress protein [Desulfamplus sp.]|nr:universal stress protein [Desulfamplus sp.]
MEKHFMITVSEDKSCLYAAKFAGYFFSDRQNIKATLFNTAPKPPILWGNERSLEADIEQQEQLRQIHAKSQSSLENVKKMCVELGFSPDNVNTKLKDRLFSKVSDIIQEGEKGQYDAVIMGQRGLSMLEKIFDESISEEIFQQSFTFPLWLCRSADPARKNILLYVDGSETSYRMADHVGFILNGETKHSVTILIMDEKEIANRVLAKTIEHLLYNDFPEELIDTWIIEKGNLAKIIMEEVDKKNYAVVALGRSGGETNPLKRIFKGEVCYTLFKEIKDAALWVCY